MAENKKGSGIPKPDNDDGEQKLCACGKPFEECDHNPNRVQGPPRGLAGALAAMAEAKMMGERKDVVDRLVDMANTMAAVAEQVTHLVQSTFFGPVNAGSFQVTGSELKSMFPGLKLPGDPAPDGDGGDGGDDLDNPFSDKKLDS